ncbi:hypothetical protein CR513_57960, partial [Mucuna pruriens]
MRNSYFKKALCDLGVNINLIPYSVLNKLGLKEPQPTNISLQLANKTITHPLDIADDVLVKVESSSSMPTFSGHKKGGDRCRVGKIDYKTRILISLMGQSKETTPTQGSLTLEPWQTINDARSPSKTGLRNINSNMSSNSLNSAVGTDSDGRDELSRRRHSRHAESSWLMERKLACKVDLISRDGVGCWRRSRLGEEFIWPGRLHLAGMSSVGQDNFIWSGRLHLAEMTSSVYDTFDLSWDGRKDSDSMSNVRT